MSLVIEAEAVLDADDRGDGLRLVQLADADVRDAEVPDQARGPQVGQRAEVIGDGVQSRIAAQVDHVEVVAAELAQVLLDLAA